MRAGEDIADLCRSGTRISGLLPVGISDSNKVRWCQLPGDIGDRASQGRHPKNSKAVWAKVSTRVERSR